MTKKKKWTKDEFFVPECHAPEEDEEHLSPSGKYKLTIQSYHTTRLTGERSWEYTQGIIVNVKTSEELAVVRRNYHRFWHLWLVQGEKEYLLCGENYQGYGVIDPQAKTVQHHLPEEAQKGHGFCFAEVRQTAPDRIMVHGCHWGGPFEVRMYDVSNPTSLPYPLIEQRDSAGDFDPDFGDWNEAQEGSNFTPEEIEGNKQFCLEHEHLWRESALSVVKDALRRYRKGGHIYKCEQYQAKHDLKSKTVCCNCKDIMVDYALQAAVLLARNLPLTPSIFEDTKYYTHAEAGEDHDRPLMFEGQETLDADMIRETYRNPHHSQSITWRIDE